MSDHFPPSNWVPLKEADLDYLPTDSGESYKLRSKEEVERLLAKRAKEEDGLRFELAWAEISHLYN